MSDATRILDRAQQGDPQAAEELLHLVYEELGNLAAVDAMREIPWGIDRGRPPARSPF